MRNLMRWMAPLGLVILLGGAGCTESADADGGDAGSWIDSDAELDDSDGKSTGGEDTGATSESEGTDDDNGGDSDVGDDDNSGPDDPSGPDPETPDTGNDDGNDPGNAEILCDTNTDCETDEVCCLDGFQGGQSCQAASACQVGGGTCDTADECAADEGCCDLGGQFPNVCSVICADGNGGLPGGDGGFPGGGTPGSGDFCEQDVDCVNVNEVCCPGLMGSSCATDCGGAGFPGGGDGFPGGEGGFTSCSGDSECGGGEECCSLMGQSMCVPAGLGIPCE